jgi:hypothetical protein
MIEVDGIPGKILKLKGQRVLVLLYGWPFPRWVDKTEVQLAPFVSAPF